MIADLRKKYYYLDFINTYKNKLSIKYLCKRDSKLELIKNIY